MLATRRAAMASRLSTCSCMAWLPAPAPAPARPTQQQLRVPGQFSSSYGSSSLLPPSLYISRAKLPSQMAQQRLPPLSSFLGVGAPEAILVGIVALVVFGPKGLAEAAKGVGAALRSFQPTIREVVEVSQDIKGTLEKELGLDELRDAARVQPRARTPEEAVRSTSSAAGFATPDEDPDIEAKRRESAALAWGGQTASTPASTPTSETPAPVAAGTSSSNGSAAAPSGNVPQTLTATEAAPAPAPSPAPAAPAVALGSLSVQELEAELARRKAASQQQEQKHS